MYYVCYVGAMSDVFGSDRAVEDEESCCRMYESKSGMCRSIFNLLQVPQFNHQVELEIGVLEEECSQLMKSFFRELREEKARKKAEENSVE